MGKGFIKGMGIKDGALATTLIWDTCNILTIGSSEKDMQEAVNRLIDIQGGTVITKNGQVIYEFPMPVYGLIPLILGGYLAFYAKMFILGAWRFVPNVFFLFGREGQLPRFSLLPAETTATLLHIIILGGLLASVYAVGRIFSRFEAAEGSIRPYVIPVSCILALGVMYLAII